jgi:two-component system, OmpR family, KDP operon response regulator KdpE
VTVSASETRILCVDDDPQILRALVANLRARQYAVDAASSGEAALRIATNDPPDAVIVDLGLPGLSGLDVIAGLRGWTAVPIIVLSARDGETDKIAALDAGADDYIAKPFGMGELLARLRAALRRANRTVDPSGAASRVETPDFVVDLAEKRATAKGVEVRLTPTEWGIVELLVRNANRLVTGRQLLQAVWGPTYGEETNYLRVHLAHIRRKLEPAPGDPRYFITESGIGYRFECRPVQSEQSEQG